MNQQTIGGHKIYKNSLITSVYTELMVRVSISVAVDGA
jgi:hypothetical protein